MDAVKELKWFVAGIIILGVIWIAAGGLKSVTKNNPFVRPAAPLSTGGTYGSSNRLMSVLFPWARVSTSSNPLGAPKPGRNSSLPISQGALPIVNNTQLIGMRTAIGGTKGNYYGADKPPGPTINVPDTVKIVRVQPSADYESDAPADEYLEITAPLTNQKPYLLTGMLLKSRMTGNQQDIRDGIPLYYTNTVNQRETIFLKPGETAYVISGRSPLGYSFKINKCIGYLDNTTQSWVIGLPAGCPGILDYPLPARPNAFSDNCLDFLKRVGSCQSRFRYPTNIEDACKNFVAERMSYTRCVADFGNDPNFLGPEWRIYLSREVRLWKSRREIVDLLDQKGNLISTHSY